MRDGEVLERRYGGEAVRNAPETGRYRCLATTALDEPCKNITRWFYRPSNSHLCLSHIRQRRAKSSA